MSTVILSDSLYHLANSECYNSSKKYVFHLYFPVYLWLFHHSQFLFIMYVLLPFFLKNFGKSLFVLFYFPLIFMSLIYSVVLPTFCLLIDKFVLIVFNYFPSILLSLSFIFWCLFLIFYLDINWLIFILSGKLMFILDFELFYFPVNGSQTCWNRMVSLLLFSSYSLFLHSILWGLFLLCDFNLRSGQVSFVSVITENWNLIMFDLLLNIWLIFGNVPWTLEKIFVCLFLGYRVKYIIIKIYLFLFRSLIL